MSNMYGNIFGNVIMAYTREDSISDGVLVDVSKMASEAGWKYPVAITSSVNEIIKNIPEEHSHQDEKGRLWDLLTVAKLKARYCQMASVFTFSICPS